MQSSCSWSDGQEVHHVKCHIISADPPTDLTVDYNWTHTPSLHAYRGGNAGVVLKLGGSVLLRRRTVRSVGGKAWKVTEVEVVALCKYAG